VKINTNSTNTLTSLNLYFNQFIIETGNKSRAISNCNLLLSVKPPPGKEPALIGITYTAAGNIFAGGQITLKTNYTYTDNMLTPRTRTLTALGSFELEETDWLDLSNKKIDTCGEKLTPINITLNPRIMAKSNDKKQAVSFDFSNAIKPGISLHITWVPCK